MNKEVESADLKAGDWINIGYGWERSDFYVTRSISGVGVHLSKPSWLVSSAIFLTDEALKAGHSPVYIGRSKLKWYWKLLPFRDLVCPFKRPPLVDI